MNLVNAVETGSIRQVKKCLANGADVNKPNKYGETPLERAYCNNDGKLVRFLLKSGAKIVGPWFGGLISLNQNAAILKQLLKARLDPNGDYISEQTLLTAAIRRGCTRIVSCLLDAGANPNMHELGELGGTPIMFAAYYNRVYILEKLFAYGADVNMVDYVWFNALFYARMGYGTMPVCRWLVEHGINVNQRGKNGVSVLTQFGDLRQSGRKLTNVEKYLITHGATD